MKTNRAFEDDLEKSLQDPENAAYFANAQVESGEELLRCGVIKRLDSTSSSNKKRRGTWIIRN